MCCVILPPVAADGFTFTVDFPERVFRELSRQRHAAAAQPAAGPSISPAHPPSGSAPAPAPAPAPLGPVVAPAPGPMNPALSPVTAAHAPAPTPTPTAPAPSPAVPALHPPTPTPTPGTCATLSRYEYDAATLLFSRARRGAPRTIDSVDWAHVLLQFWPKMTHLVHSLSSLQFSKALFSFRKILQNFSDSPSHQIFRRMHKVLNIDKNKN